MTTGHLHDDKPKGFRVKVFSSPDYVCSEHGFDTTRKAGWVADSLVRRPIEGVSIVAPESLTFDDVASVHAADYVRAVSTGTPRELAESQGFDWGQALWRMVLASNGGVVAAAHAALDDGAAGSLSSGLHHAKRDCGSGFCTFNGLAIAARKLLSENVIGSALIFDLDAHCGGGTAQLVHGDDRIWHADVSVSAFDSYSGHGNSALHLVDQASEYLGAVEASLAAADRIGPFDLVLYNAGMDPYQGCAIGGLVGITSDLIETRESMVFEFCRARQIPVAFVLAGGYVGRDLQRQQLVDLHRLTVSAAAAMK